VSGTTIPRHFQCKKCRFDGLKNETNNSRRFIRSSHRRACAVSGLPPITPTICRLQQPTGNPPALSPSSLASEICPARKRTSSASGASHVSQGNPARREVGAATSAACLRRQWSATALTELSEAIAHPGVAVIGVQRDAAQKRVGRVIARAPESRAPPVRILREINRGHGLPQSTDGGGGEGGMRRASSLNIGFPLFAYRSRAVARTQSSAVLAASSRSNATWTRIRASRRTGSFTATSLMLRYCLARTARPARELAPRCYRSGEGLRGTCYDRQSSP